LFNLGSIFGAPQMHDPKMEQFLHILGHAYCEGNLSELSGDSNPM
jgi:hypothetical protein